MLQLPMKTITLRRVVVTGLGAVTDLGTDVDSTWEGMVSGRTGIGPITAFEQDDEWTTRFAGEVKGFDPSDVADVRESKRMDRASLLGLVAAEEAALDCGIDFETGDPDRRGVAIGSGIGGIITIELGLQKLERTSPKKISPFTVPKLMVNACAGNVSIRQQPPWRQHRHGDRLRHRRPFDRRRLPTDPARRCRRHVRRRYGGRREPSLHRLLWNDEGLVDSKRRP